MISGDLIADIDAWAGRQDIAKRSEAILALIERGLRAGNMSRRRQ
jgi:metal-responsive CopG/Arc/MetJ family transcriptional regulator